MPGAKPNPTPILFPTPNYTMTALFSQEGEIPPTITPPVVVVVTQVEQTAAPTSEPIEVTNTPVVVLATATPIVAAATNTAQPIRVDSGCTLKK